MEEEPINIEGIFPCPFCLIMCHKSRDLINHLQQHYQKAPANTEEIEINSEAISSEDSKNFNQDKVLKPSTCCSICGRDCHDNFNLKRHISRVHDESRPFKCSQCSYFFKTHIDLERHETFIHKEDLIFGKYPCKICGQTFERKYLKRHLKSAHNLNIQTGIKSGSVFNSRLNESKTNSAVKVNKNRVFNLPRTKQWLDRIRPTFEKEGKFYKCPKCPHKDESLSSLIKQHIKKIHDESRPFKCSECNNFYNDIGQLHKHEARIHGKTAESVDSPDVDPEFKSDLAEPTITNEPSEPSEIKQEIKQEKPLEFNEVDKLIASLERDGKYYKCPKCGYRSTKPMKLIEEHLKTVHDESRPFKCSHCNSFFNDVGNFTQHERRFHKKQPLTNKTLWTENCLKLSHHNLV